MTSLNNGRLNFGQGTALLIGAVLGPGTLVLPRLASDAAGPASILAWAGLLLLSVPVALTFAALGVRHPGSGGVAAFTALAFGPRASAVVGWWFFGSVPVGTLAGALVGGEYVAATLHVDARIVAFGLLAAAVATNALGLRTSGRIQLGLVSLLVLLLATAVITAAPHLRADRFTPFAPHGALGVAHAAGVLFFAFVGWEAATHLSAELTGIRRATLAALTVVGLLYLGLAVTTTGFGASTVTDLLTPVLGRAAAPVTAVAALFLTFGAINTYIAGAARLGTALARDRLLPRVFTDLHRSLLLIAALMAVAAVPVALWDIGLDPLMRATAACLAAVTTAGVAAAVRLLPSRTAMIATVASAVGLLCCGPYLLVPALLAVAVGGVAEYTLVSGGSVSCEPRAE
ncbi:APC family permease [Actinocorallia longicatena]|uniref:Amino acid permease n=1 Tax=Actinocorallia longicatena TaxID=111803 RepID=A0ABP6QCL5_9ACTN